MRKLIILSALIFSAGMLQGQGLEDYRNRNADTRLPIEGDQRQGSIDALQQTLDELISQRHAVQQAHWNVQGPLFYTLHEMLEEFYETLNAQIDVVAERKVILGAPASGKVGSVAQSVDFQEFPEGFVDDRQVLEVLSARYKTMSDRLYERIEATENDLPSQDVLIAVVRLIDKQLWMLRSFQQ